MLVVKHLRYSRRSLAHYHAAQSERLQKHIAEIEEGYSPPPPRQSWARRHPVALGVLLGVLLSQCLVQCGTAEASFSGDVDRIVRALEGIRQELRESRVSRRP